MSGFSSVSNRIVAALSGWSNAIFGQRLGQARLNAMAAYDQSNELFQV
jgi:cyclopropane-fatty-acyl-phospholipid synthase